MDIATPTTDDRLARLNTVADRAFEHLGSASNRVIVYDGDTRKFTLSDIVSKARKLASALKGLGLREGNTVSFQLPNWHETLVINLASSMLGLRVNPITPIYRGAELRFILGDAQSSLIFIPSIFRSINYVTMLAELRAELPDLNHIITVRAEPESEHSYERLIKDAEPVPRSALPSVDPQAAKLVLYTSGTTGRAKGVVHTHESISHCVKDTVNCWGIKGDDKMLMASPVTHITGYAYGLELPFFSEAPLILIDHWSPKKAIQLVDGLHATISIGATPFLKELIDEAEHEGSQLESMRLFACGGASVLPDLIIRTAQVTARCNASRVYGATEVPLVTKGFFAPEERDLAAETDGRVFGYEVKITDPAGKALPAGEVGEICARGKGLFKGYTDSAETAAAIDHEGYFRTGDLGILTEQGAVIVTGRKKDIIIRGGENLSPVEIEAALEKHPAVEEAAVVAMPHPRLGEGVAAFIMTAVGEEQPTLIELTEFLDNTGLARQKFPERLEYMNDFPRTASGKIRKDSLRKALRQPLVINLGD